MGLKMTVIEKNSQEVLFQCDLEESHKAHEFAALLEEQGMDVEVRSPSITETLAQALGKSDEEKEIYRESVESELNDHDCLSGNCDLSSPSPTNH